MGIFYWNQLSDEERAPFCGVPPPFGPVQAQAKIWTASSADGPGMRWRRWHLIKGKVDDSEVHNTKTTPWPTQDAAHLFLAAYRAALKDYTGTDIPIVGHSLGAQMAVRMIWLLTHDSTKENPKLLPQRVALLDPYWSAGPVSYFADFCKKKGAAQLFPYLNCARHGHEIHLISDALANMISEIKQKDQSMSFEYYRTTDLAAYSQAIEAQTVVVRLEPAFAGNQALLWNLGSAHGAAIYWYFMSLSYLPLELICDSLQAQWRKTGLFTPSARMPNATLHKLMEHNDYCWEQYDGATTPTVRDDSFERMFQGDCV